MELSFCELRAKEVVNICDGKKMGNIIDLIFDSSCARITGLVVPGEKSFLNIFKSSNDIFIPYNRIRKIGTDIILVELTPVNTLAKDKETKVKTSSFDQDIVESDENNSKLDLQMPPNKV